jgi:hypothetical protein
MDIITLAATHWLRRADQHTTAALDAARRGDEQQATEHAKVSQVYDELTANLFAFASKSDR